MKILAVGDVTSPRAVQYLEENLWRVREREKIDFCIVNGENASLISGISAQHADRLIKSGADVITGGNHTMYQRAAYTYLDDTPEIIRPINFGGTAPGRGYTVVNINGYKLLVINAMGNVHIEPSLDSAYPYIDRVLSELAGRYDFAVLDIHAEATGEKLAMGYNYDGIISVVFGTHTHVQTADERILPEGTGYITDVGMCGAQNGILGMNAACVIKRMKTKLPERFEEADGKIVANGAIFDLDTSTGKVTSVKRISF